AGAGARHGPRPAPMASPARRQRTVARAGEVAGVGLHSGARTSLRIQPAPAGSGVTFVRTDLAGRPRIPADHAHIGKRPRCTSIQEGSAEVHTIEHLLAALLALQVDNLEVEIDGPECPGLDGSALEFLALVEHCGSVEQDALRERLVVERPVTVAAGEGAAVSALPARAGLTLGYTLDYGPGFPGRQHVTFPLDAETFRREVAPARTFCMEAEADALRKAGLGKGASTENTLVLQPGGGARDTTLRWPDEPARHKLLDLMGDLFLLGADLQATVLAHRTGHEANQDLVRALRRGEGAAAAGAPAAAAPAGARAGAPGGPGPAAPAADGPGPFAPRPGSMCSTQVRRVLPHRYPFLLVDRVVEMEGFQRAVGLKNVSVNEPFFQGHYPAEPIMPGVLIVEALAQLAGLLLLRKLELSGKLPVLLSIDRVKFRRTVVPGDQLRLEAETLRLAGGRGRVRCRASVDGALVAEARLNFALTEASQA
ncbi:MAG: UDP-3-O-acyl-N-acetylglucosamine deacetylase, partial [Planctomycetia bacterium]